MPIFPKPLSEKAELDYKLGIKSSLNHIASVVALTYALFLSSGKKSRVMYSDEYIVNGVTKIRISKDILDYLLKTFVSSTDTLFNSNPLLQAQMEALQVGVQLIYKLARVSFVDGSSSTRERTGGNRYAKQLDFGTNMLLLDTVLSAYQYEDVVAELGLWLSNRPSNSAISQSIKRLLVIFSEDIPAKLRSADGEETVFTQQGIYERFLEGQSVVGSDAKENVGTFRVFNSIIKEDVHPFIQSSNGFLVSRESLENLKEYNDMVVNSSFMLPKRAIITTETIVDKSEVIDNQTISNTPRQVIYYGAPGTGKSYKIKGLVNKGNHVRTTFHPDSDYASFVGAYKPTMEVKNTRDVTGRVIYENGKPVVEKKIVYDFVAQAFLQAYTEAWKRWAGVMTDKDGNNIELPEDMHPAYYLVIEEINRGNCAQIFGDLFQLLDRDDNGESSYAIRPDQDIKRYLAETFADIAALPDEIRSGDEMKLPANLYIYATMNTSDQSLFPIDSAFKRRWDWEYVPIKDEEKGYYIQVGDSAYAWSSFIAQINETILRVTQSDDKQMGYWFVHLPEGEKAINTDKFVGKVLFYLWNDVFKDFGGGEETIFIGKRESGEEYELRFKDFFGADRDTHIHALMRKNGVEEAEVDLEQLSLDEGIEENEKIVNPTAYDRWKSNHLGFWSDVQTAFAQTTPAIVGSIGKPFYLFDIASKDTNLMYRLWHYTHKGRQYVAAGIAFSEALSDEQFKAYTNLIPALNSASGRTFKFEQEKGVKLLKTYSSKVNFNDQASRRESIQWLADTVHAMQSVIEA